MILSICIPTYNRLENLDNCLNSILISSKNVKNFDFEVCISDNFSDQNPQEIEFGRPFTHRFYSHRHKHFFIPS